MRYCSVMKKFARLYVFFIFFFADDCWWSWCFFLGKNRLRATYVGCVNIIMYVSFRRRFFFHHSILYEAFGFSRVVILSPFNAYKDNNAVSDPISAILYALLNFNCLLPIWKILYRCYDAKLST